MKLQVKFDNSAMDVFKRFELASKGQLDKAIEEGTKLAAQFVLAEVVKRIEERKYQGLAHSTLVLRAFDGYGNIPLKRTGALVRSIAREIISSGAAQVGLLQQRKKTGKGPDSFANIGRVLHDGAVIKVTDAMRRAFARRWGAVEAASGVRFRRPGGGKAGVIRIKPRRFIGDVFEDPIVEEKVKKIYSDAIERKYVLLGGSV